MTCTPERRLRVVVSSTLQEAACPRGQALATVEALRLALPIVDARAAAVTG